MAVWVLRVGAQLDSRAKFYERPISTASGIEFPAVLFREASNATCRSRLDGFYVEGANGSRARHLRLIANLID